MALYKCCIIIIIMLMAVAWVGYSDIHCYLSVFPNDIPKTNAARVTILGIHMFHG